MSSESSRGVRKQCTGTVISDKMDKSIVVSVTQRYRHALYGKVVTRKRKFHAHDENNEAKQGDTVRLIETRPISKLKRWRLSTIVKRAGQTA